MIKSTQEQALAEIDTLQKNSLKYFSLCEKAFKEKLDEYQKDINKIIEKINRKNNSDPTWYYSSKFYFKKAFLELKQNKLQIPKKIGSEDIKKIIKIYQIYSALPKIDQASRFNPFKSKEKFTNYHNHYNNLTRLDFQHSNKIIIGIKNTNTGVKHKMKNAIEIYNKKLPQKTEIKNEYTRLLAKVKILYIKLLKLESHYKNWNFYFSKLAKEKILFYKIGKSQDFPNYEGIHKNIKNTSQFNNIIIKTKIKTKIN